MSGAKRKGKFRKGVEDDYLNSLPLPEEGDSIAQVLGARGSNIFEVALSAKEVSAKSSAKLALLPNKYRNVIWVKTKDFLILNGGSESSRKGAEGGDGEGEEEGGDLASPSAETGSKVQYAIKHILNKNQIKYIKKAGMWPDHFSSDKADDFGGGGGGGGGGGYADDLAGMGDYDMDDTKKET